MLEVRIRRKHQITLPASVVREAGLEVDDRLIFYVNNGTITMIPKSSLSTKEGEPDLMSFSGIGKKLWGDTPEAVDAAILNLRDSWSR
jgi:bifunctional DNA-binding transcriptional regulator/antitoxin component of YhaV-PrlF toxin-antitoxin module